MQIEPSTATAIVPIVLGLSLAVVLPGMPIVAPGYLGEAAQFLAVSWLIESALVATTTFLEIHQGASFGTLTRLSSAARRFLARPLERFVSGIFTEVSRPLRQRGQPEP